MTVLFDNALICEKVDYEYKGKTYPYIVIYSQGKLYRISNSHNVNIDNFNVGDRLYCECEMSIYQNKTKLKLIQVSNV